MISKRKVEDAYFGLLIAAIGLANLKGNVDEQLRQIKDSIQENSQNIVQFMSAWEFVEIFCEICKDREIS